MPRCHATLPKPALPRSQTPVRQDMAEHSAETASTSHQPSATAVALPRADMRLKEDTQEPSARLRRLCTQW